ncbi:MAG TPA: FtsX-like permease family protein [Candidatus Onthousia faecipullorum]|uniref:FtsX-like permease family protein n=1 Tax=Candidatus Onthousia faecipullorum TaxID=2840887 RepID=A0A9D1KAX0_9FIRM|nr:FtsX-like permease family protein [Candidatus Onthousia faecipullorum]
MLIFKNSFRKIWKSKGRFLSLILIVILGTSFFAGVRETATDMIRTLDNYYDETNLYDFKIVSTMGLTLDDISSLKDIKGIKEVLGSYSFDTLIDGNAVKVSALSDISKVTLIDGKMPENNTECLSLEGYFEIGDTITIDDDTYLNNNTCKIVGTVNSSSYIYENKGISTVGDGKLDSLIYVVKDNFKLDYYTEIYLIAENTKEELSYSEEFDEIIEKVNKELQELKPLRETARYEEILKEAMDKIIEAEDELNRVKSENETKFNNALIELNSNKITLDEGLEEYNSGLESLNKTKESTEEELNNGFNALESAKVEFNNALSSIGLTVDKLQPTLDTINTNIEQLEQQLNNIDPSDSLYETLTARLNELKINKTNIETLINTNNTLIEQETTLNNSLNTWNREYNNALNEFNNAKKDIDSGYRELNKGYEEYNTNYNLYLEEIREYEKEINDAKVEVNNIEKPVWYLLTREDLTGYTSFYESATKVDSIAAVFPIFFILIAFLMAFNTMNRMIEEERSEIGAFISLGIKKSTITFSYLLYVFIACILGLVIGLSIGYSLIPRILYTVYSASFTIPELSTYANPYACLIIVLTTFILMSLVVLITLIKDFKLAPATILRPASPKSGKKILLEHIKPFWKRLSFSWKITLRNLFRYKKRIFMTVLGISGCTALLLTGFGIKDSLSDFLDIQFNDITHYDATLVLNDDVNKDDVTKSLIDNNLTNYINTNISSFTFKANNKNLDFTLIAFMDDDSVNDFVTLKSIDGEDLTLSDDGVIITEKMASLLNAEVGKNISIRNSDNRLFVVKVLGICENYISNYLYMNSTYYEEIFEDNNYNSFLVNLDESTDKEELSNNLLDTGYFGAIQYTEDSMTMFNDIIRGMNNIVYLIIAFSSFLAITVLYNLTIININERKREIATLKVLGFRDREVSSYVYRETIILTIVGIIVGIFLGFSLNTFVLMIAETDELLFIKIIKPLSYVLSFIIIIIFSIIVQVITFFILKRVDMIDSLKSVE